MSAMVIWDISGPQAMFRKYYTNSSSLTYGFPPRTVIAGMAAGLMGYARDTYSEALHPDKCRLALAIREPFRTVMQTVNYIFTKNAKDFDGSAGGTQIPIEWLFPAVDRTELRYRIYLTHKDDDWLYRFSHIISTGTWHYPPYLGMSECIAKVNYVQTLSDYEEIPSGELVDVRTVIPAEGIEDGPELQAGLELIREQMPIYLDANRRLAKIGAFLYDRNLQLVKVRLNCPSFRVQYEEPEIGTICEEIGVFME